MSRGFKNSVLALTAVMFGLWPGRQAEGRPARNAQLPNGAVYGCANCHVSASGGGPLNVFGRQIQANFLSAPGPAGVVLWGPELARLDADDDGATNGEELGDPDGAWKISDPVPGDPAAVTKPWDASSRPPEPAPTAVASSGWARLKIRWRAMLE